MAAHHNINPNQLKMFMTPNEIHAQYQPLDGDREDVFTDDREGSYTARSHDTQGRSNYPVYAAPGQPKAAKGFYRQEHPETDSQLWDRKLGESQMSQADYDEAVRGEHDPPEFTGGWDRTGAPQYQTGHTRTYESREASWHEARGLSHQAKESDYYEGRALYDSVEKEGVQYPLHLGTAIGSQGKPQIAGGHHRLAAATHINPHQLLPVIHHEGSTRDARESAQSGGYEYR